MHGNIAEYKDLHYYGRECAFVIVFLMADHRSEVENGRTKLIVVGQIVHTLNIIEFYPLC